ncbi:hypothetical protein [Fimbriiglobus ruber]|uniref:Uncharacterized protein n=1 Tax=Fimbriiglobus ruber TaxID=1908690 RepID=A0A225E137_9BACT|nr:hypothetical protein [Fimbriiglobus ruber]OWK43199.1 hypothetical protein FRUB_02798 [Fimbriiglobus ruber]
MTQFRSVLSAGLLLLVPAVASAHAVGIEAKLKGERVVVEAYYDDDSPAADAKIAVTGENGQLVAEGKTDAKGVWSFPTPVGGKYQVAVNAGDGHSAKTSITIPPQASPNPATTTEPSTTTIPNPAGDDTAKIVSDGPTRAETTGSRRWLMAVVGVGVIGLFTLAARRLARRAVSGEN